MIKILNYPFKDIECPVCGKKTIIDPSAQEYPTLPPTGKDYDYASQSVYRLACSSCNAKFKLKESFNKVQWAPNWDVEYYKGSIHGKKLEKLEQDQLIIEEK